MDKVSGLVNDGIPGHDYFIQGQREVIQFLRMEGYTVNLLNLNWMCAGHGATYLSKEIVAVWVHTF
jgi:hypothetical protein